MANPATNDVNAKTATPTTTTTTTTAAPEPDAEPADAYRVLKAFTLDDGRTVMPGEKFVPADVEKWPARRSKQLVDQKFLRPIT